MKPVRRFWVSSISQNKACVFAIVLGVAYILSYAIWSRTAFVSSRQFGDTKSFHYFPVDSGVPESLELAVRIVFCPLNWIDQKLFGSPWPGGFIDKDLG